MTFWQWLGWQWHMGPLRDIAELLAIFLFWGSIIFVAWMYFPMWTQIILAIASTIGLIWLKMASKR